MDDLDIGGIIMEWIGFETEEKSSTEEKIGEERLGSSNMLDSFGATLIIGSLIFFVVIVLVLVIVIVAKRINNSPKCLEIIKKIKRSIFFNPIIRYIVLNSLKFDLQALVAIKASEDW